MVLLQHDLTGLSPKRWDLASSNGGGGAETIKRYKKWIAPKCDVNPVRSGIQQIKKKE